MTRLVQIETGDRKLLKAVDTAFADAARRSGAWLVCREGCSQCCVGTFAISQLDAERLRRGMRELLAIDPTRAGRIRRRARTQLRRLRSEFPGDPVSGILGDSASEQERFEDFANDEPCPALDPKSGRCEIYEFRPMTCRVFGPPLRTEDGIGCCELCFHGAKPEEVAACELHIDLEAEERLNAKFEQASGRRGQTIIAYVLAE